MAYREVGLEQVLRFREEKDAVQKDFTDGAGDHTVVSLGMNVPGPVKTGPLLSEAFLEGMEAFEQLLAQWQHIVIKKKIIDDRAGYAAVYLLEGTDRFQLKRDTVRLEDTHTLGRLYDLDVMGESGKSLTRKQIGENPRTCLLCGKDAKVCGRSRAHSVEELQQQTAAILMQWKAGKADEMEADPGSCGRVSCDRDRNHGVELPVGRSLYNTEARTC